ncbi:MAG TPA: FGGY-family carbohydrate kinase [Myxococcales bacterium]|nr:FGGY-family carbohydrate kinase [Myxococcales bacterium]
MSAEDRYLLAIDLGTSGPKVALFTSDCQVVVGSEVEPTRLYLEPGGGAEQDPEDWWRAVCTASRRLLGRHPEQAKRIAAVGCTAQWSGTVPVDEAGNAVGRAIIWMDSRGGKHVKRALGGFPSVMGYGAAKLLRWIRLTGGVPGHSGKDSLAHILFLKAERPDVYARAAKLLEPKDYLNLRLTGRTAASFDSITLHWVTDNRRPDRIDYHPGLLRAVGLERSRLPDLKRAVDVLGPLLPGPAAELGAPEGAQVVVGTPDIQSAAVGSGAVRDFEPHLYLGTSSWLTCHVPFQKTDAIHNMASLPSPIPGRYFIGNEQECAGACLTFLRDQVFFAQDDLGTALPAAAYRRFDDLVEKAPPGARKVIFTPWLYGERTPVEDPSIRGGWHNVSLGTTRGELVRSVYEGVAFNARWLLQAVEKFTGRTLGAIHLIGGGARSDVWCQIQADVLGRPIRQMGDPVMANARGVAIVASVGAGFGTFEEIAGKVPVARTFEPTKDRRALYEELFGEFLRLYRSSRTAHARLNRRTQ